LKKKAAAAKKTHGPRTTTTTTTTTRRGSREEEDDEDGDDDDKKKPTSKQPKRPWNPGAGPAPKPRAGGAGGSASTPEASSWYESARALDDEMEAGARKRAMSEGEPTRGVLEAKETTAKGALEERTNAYAKKMQRHGDANSKWLEMVRTSGTASDKVAANVLSVTEDPGGESEIARIAFGVG
jgi:ribosome biogenesis protein MAK21